MMLMRILILAWGFMVSWALFAQATAPAQNASAQLFEKKCYSCHNIGAGDKRGPDLKGVTQRRTREWIHTFVKSPESAKNRGDATAIELFKRFQPTVMPDQDLNPENLDAILNLIDELTRKNVIFVPAGAKLARAIVPSDVAAGRNLFLGRVRLQNGGPACISCHSVTGIGFFGGGTLGPNLTQANVKYRDPELINILQGPAFPTMASQFGDHPLTPDEIVKLFAFFQDLKTRNVQPAAVLDTHFPLVGVGGLFLLLLLIDFLWRKRFRGVREFLVRGRK